MLDYVRGKGIPLTAYALLAQGRAAHDETLQPGRAGALFTFLSKCYAFTVLAAVEYDLWEACDAPGDLGPTGGDCA
jgi:hypothetical protein